VHAAAAVTAQSASAALVIDFHGRRWPATASPEGVVEVVAR
jgi:hypothetical protein